MADSKERDVASDLLIREVDEDLRRDEYAKLWKKYGIFLIAAAVLLVLGVAGYQGWRSWRNSRAEADSVAFAAASALIEANRTDDAAAALARLATDGHTGFTVVAGFDRAALLTHEGKVAEAEAAYDQIAAGDAPKELRELATIKHALVALGGNEDLASIRPRVEAIAVAGDPWYYAASEVLAVIALKTGDRARATTLFKQLADDRQAPQGVRTRASEMLAALGQAAPSPSPAPSAPAKTPG